MGAFQPDPMLLNFLLLKEFVYLPALAVLALLRGLVGRGAARLAAGVAVLLAALGAAAVIGPGTVGLQGGPVVATAIKAGNLGGGMALPLLASAPMLASAFLPGVRWRWIDALHLLLIGALLTMWLMAR